MRQTMNEAKAKAKYAKWIELWNAGKTQVEMAEILSVGRAKPLKPGTVGVTVHNMRKRWGTDFFSYRRERGEKDDSVGVPTVTTATAEPEEDEVDEPKVETEAYSVPTDDDGETPIPDEF